MEHLLRDTLSSATLTRSITFLQFYIVDKIKKTMFLFEWSQNSWSVFFYFILSDFSWSGRRGCRGTLGGVGTSRQRRPAGKECWCPAELILAGRKEKMWTARGEGEESARWQRKVFFCLEMKKKEALLIHGFLSNFHLLSLSPSLAGGPAALCSLSEPFGS